MLQLERFKELGISETTLHALKKKGFEVPSPIQEKTIPLLLQGTRNIIGQAQTGTGKTAAFGIPLIEKLRHNPSAVSALVLVPTRELAVQVAEEINSLKGKSKLVILPVYGGQSIEMQIKHLRKGVDIVVGTPGRILDLLERKKLFLGNISHLILDEADEMLNMGFIDDVDTILSKTGQQKQILLFSATMPDAIRQIASKYMGDFVHVKVTESQLATPLTEQIYFEVRPEDKFEALCRIIDTEHAFYGIVFCRTKVDVDTITSRLIDRGYDAEGLHGDITQATREKILKSFRSRRISILVATDVAARGIDISDLTHVINYALPQDPESYVHRIGRTGRAGKEGTAVTFITPSEYQRLAYIRRTMKVDIQKRKLPAVSDVISVKKAKIKHDLEEIVTKGKHMDYLGLAQELAGEHEATSIIAAFLQHFYEDELRESNYQEIVTDISVDRKGKSRLFIAMGKIDRITPEILVELLGAQGGIPAHLIWDVKVYDKFSFVTTTFSEAERVIKQFSMTKRHKKSSKPLITRAQNEKNKKTGGRR